MASVTGERLRHAGNGDSIGIDVRDRWEVVRDGMREMIVYGELLPGQRLNEVDLARTFEVSRGPLREALRALETEGLAVRVPRRGTFVVQMSATDVDEIYSLRAALEELAVRRALESPSPQLLARLDALVDEMREATAVSDWRRVTECDIEFHTAVYEAAGHARVLSAWNSLREPMRVLVGMTSEVPEQTWRDHALLANAARQGVDEYLTAAREHIERARLDALDIVRERQ